ncbi:MAG: polysaccharide pyruvyl transferase family protein [Fimbriimonadaceae bacterium]|nr:polysaccharide pyruvyl transferase family protein [Fimbriimonadaceae bacterium]
MSARLLLAGYFGCGNLGDDAILLGFLEGIKDKPYELITLSGSPDRMMNSYGLRGIPRLDFNEVNKAIDEVDALVFPGGSIFQDVTSMRSVGYYYKLVANAKRKKKKVILLGQGVGPLNRTFGKMLTAKAFNMADVVVVRDPASGQVAKQLGMKNSPRSAADMAFLLPKPQISEDSNRYGVAGMKTIGVSIRPHGKDKGKAVSSIFAEVCQRMFQEKNMTVLIEMDQMMDKRVMDMVSKANGGKVPDSEISRLR